MTEPLQAGPLLAKIREGFVKSINLCRQGEAASNAVLEDLTGISPNGKRSESNIITLGPQKPKAPLNQAQRDVHIIQTQAVILQSIRLLMADRCVTIDKQEHGTSGKVGDERGSQSPEDAYHEPSCTVYLKAGMACDCKATSQGSQQHGSSVSTRTAVNPSSGKGSDQT